MGVSGLLNLLKSIQKPTHLRSFNGNTIGVDAYGWLHRGAVSCAVDLALGNASTKHVEFAMHRVRMLAHFGVTPYLVFDGDRLPSKAATEHERAQRRKESKARGLELLRLGKTTQAHQELQKSVDITPEMAGQLMEELRRNNVQFVVAPYEADSQLVYLESQGLIDGILSEDSDLLVFGAKTLLTKLDQYGECIMIRQADYTACREVNLTGWTCADLRRMAILSGCDYLEGVHKMGLKTAYRLVRKCKTIQRVVQCAQLEGKFRFPLDYLDSFAQAEMTFLYQWVYCPTAKELVNLTPPESANQLDGITYIGEYVEPDIAQRVATGHLNPITKLPIVVAWPANYRQPPLMPKQAVKETNPSPKCKKIDSFFTPTTKRVPLAELDPNSFAPSQSQQRLLEQNNDRSWSPAMANQRPLSAQLPRHRDDGGQQTRQISSAPRVPKRPRLCAASIGSEDALFDAHEERSRFFTTKESTKKSSPISGRRGKKGKGAAINIWSDDSVEDAMAAIPDQMPGSAQGDELSGNANGPEPTALLPDKTTLVKDYEEKISNAQHCTSCSQNIDRPKEEVSPFAAGLEAQIEDFRERYTLKKANPSIPDSTALNDGLESLSKSAVLMEPLTPPHSNDHNTAKPAQLDSETEAAVEETPIGRQNVEAHSSPLTGKHVVARAEVTQDDLPAVLTSCRRTVRPKGSEDLLIVPDSDAETSCSEYGADTTPRRGATFWSDSDDAQTGKDRGVLWNEAVDLTPDRRTPATLDLKRFAFGAV